MTVDWAQATGHVVWAQGMLLLFLLFINVNLSITGSSMMLWPGHATIEGTGLLGSCMFFFFQKNIYSIYSLSYIL